MAIRPPLRSEFRRTIARAVAVLARSVGTLLLMCGGLLVLVGLGVHLSRQQRLAADERLRLAPRFEDTLEHGVAGPSTDRAAPATGALEQPAAAPARATAAPRALGTPAAPVAPGPPGEKRVADPGPSVSLGPRVVVFGGAGGQAAASATPLRRFGKGVRRTGPMPTTGGAGAGLVAKPDRILIPSIGVDRPVVPIGWTTEVVDNAMLRSVWRTADDAAGWHETSAPLGGVGNTVVSGHNNIGGAVFRSLHEVAVGDMVTLRAGAAEIRYAVERTFVVREADASDEERRANNRWIEPTDDERLTLVTCYPPWGNTHRLIVIARPVVYILPTAATSNAAESGEVP